LPPAISIDLRASAANLNCDAAFVSFAFAGTGLLIPLHGGESFADAVSKSPVCPLACIGAPGTRAFFDNYTNALPKKRLRDSDNGFTTKH
jgi:hypothetical protein